MAIESQQAPSSIPLPSTETYQHFTALISKLFSVRDSHQIHKIDEELRPIQRGSLAYGLSVRLFRSSHQANDKFFAALTLAIKLNHDPHDLDEEAQDFVFNVVLQWLVEAVGQSCPRFVINRVVETLVTVITLPAIQGYRCVPRILSEFAGVEDGGASNVPGLVLASSESHLENLMNFLSALAMHFQVQTDTLQMHNMYQKVASNTIDVITLLSTAYDQMLSNESFAHLENNYSTSVVACHLAWMKFCKSTVIDNKLKDQLDGLLSNAIGLLKAGPWPSQTFKACTSLLEDAFKDEYLLIPDQVTFAFEELLNMPKSLQCIKMERRSVGSIEANFNRMTIAFWSRQSQSTFLPASSHSREMLDNPAKSQELHDLALRRELMISVINQITSCLGHEVLEETLAMAVVEFWEEFVQNTRQHCLRTEAMTFILGAIPSFCAGSAKHDLYDQSDDSLETDAQLREDIRTRLKDLLQLCCEEYGVPVFECLLDTAEMIENQVRASSFTVEPFPIWYSTLYFVVELGESLQFSFPDDELGPKEDAALTKLFSSSWLAMLLGDGQNIPPLLQRLALRLIGEYHLYFEYDEQRLWQALDVLIEKMGNSMVASPAAVSLNILCDQNRSRIVEASYIQRVLDVCCQHFSDPGSRSESKAAIAAAVVSITKAFPNPDATAMALKQVLSIVLQDYERRVEAVESNDEHLCVIAKDVLTFLVAIGRASQSKVDDVQDILNPSENTRTYDAQLQYWRSDGGRVVQSQILHLMGTALQTAHYEESAVSQACQIFKIGFRARVSRPFTFGAQTAMSFVKSIPQNETNVESLIKMLCELISSFSSSRWDIDSDILAQLIEYVHHIMCQLRNIRDTPDIAASCITAFERILRYRSSIISSLSEPVLSLVVNFALEGITCPEAAIRRGSIQFWNALFAKVKAVVGVEREQLRAIILNSGSRLMTVLVEMVAGIASRVDLDRLADPFQSLIKEFSEARMWLGNALNVIPDARVGVHEKKKFFDTVMMLRGSPKTKTTIKSFWTQCKGLTAYYQETKSAHV